MKRASSTLHLVAGACAVAVALWVLAAGCGGGSGGAPKRREVILSTEYQDIKVGKEASQEVQAQMGLVEDPELEAMVEAIGQRLARHAPRGRFEYKFKIVDQDAPNAFALPGGFIYVSRGLLILSNSEDELANVIGHEIVHVAARHAAARQAVIRGMPPVLAFLSAGSIASYSRDQEREADRLGQGLAGIAGYDPEGMAKFMKDLEFTTRLQLGASRRPSFLDTHPATTERAATAANRAGHIRWTRKPGITADREDYLRKLEGLTVGTGAKEGVFQGDRFIHPDLGFTIRFPEGWDTRNTRQAVGAIAPTRDGAVFLEHQGAGTDPQRAAAEFVEKLTHQGLRVEQSAPIKLGRYPAFRVTGRASSSRGNVQVILTWIVNRGQVYRLTAFAPGQRYEGMFLQVARSFRPLTKELRDSVRELRVNIVTARSGESLKQLSVRTGNRWSLQETAVMNDVYANARLSSGQLIKIAVSRAYTPKPPTP